MEFKLGKTACYPTKDFGFHIYSSIPVESAVAWAKQMVPETYMGAKVKAKDIEVEKLDQQWLNKLMVIVGLADGDNKWLGLYNHDGKFYIVDRERDQS